MNNYKKATAVIVSVILVAYFALFSPIDFVGSQQNRLCKAEKLALEMTIENRLLRKYRDEKNHMYKKIVLKSGESKIDSRILVLDHSGLFDLLLPGDSIVKAHGQLSVTIYRDDKSISHKLDFQCHAVQ